MFYRSKVVVNALLKRAGLFMQDVQMAKANEDYDTAKKVDPGNSDIYHQMAQVFNFNKLDRVYLLLILLHLHFPF